VLLPKQVLVMPLTLFTTPGWPTLETILFPEKLGLNAISEVP
jgi:hypothetical protein